MNKKNNLFSFDITKQNVSIVIATFSFPNGLNGSAAKCRVEYGISPDMLNHSKEISCDGENVTLELRVPGPAKVDSYYYYYLASVITHDNQQCVYVTGRTNVNGKCTVPLSGSQFGMTFL